MGFLSNIFSKLFSSIVPERSTSPTPANSTSPYDITMSITYSDSQPKVTVSDAEVAEVVKDYKFVHSNKLGMLDATCQWFDEEIQERRLRDNSDEVYEWLLPFVPMEVAKLEKLKPILRHGPNSATWVAKELRALIRERRKAKQPYEDLLYGLYSACVMADFVESLAFEGISVHWMTRYIDIREFQDIRIEYSEMGYENFKALSKTDLKWLVQAFGEPFKHQSIDTVWPQIRCNAISRYCWEELRNSNRAKHSLGLKEETMDEWLSNRVRLNFGYHKEWLEKKAAREEKLAKRSKHVKAAWIATRAPFAVADLETTGLKADSDEIIELAALLVEPDGTVTSEFSMLVKTTRPITAKITELTGITQGEVDAHGQPLSKALPAFLSCIGERPVFFHNAPFDVGFLSTACAKANLNLKNEFYDTLQIAYSVWPSRDSYKLGDLAAYIDATVPTHRALGDAHAVLAVLLEARTRAGSLYIK